MKILYCTVTNDMQYVDNVFMETSESKLLLKSSPHRYCGLASHYSEDH